MPEVGVGLSLRIENTELVSIRIGQHHPRDVSLADVYASRPEIDKKLDLRLLITVLRRSDVEMQSVLSELGAQSGPKVMN
jgi:hypothetical protein